MTDLDDVAYLRHCIPRNRELEPVEHIRAHWDRLASIADAIEQLRAERDEARRIVERAGIQVMWRGNTAH